MRAQSSLKVASAVLVGGMALSACGVSADQRLRRNTASGPVKGLRILVPNSPGSGYDTTARAAAKAMQDAKLTETVEVFNTAGAGGTVGLQRLVNEKGQDDILMQMGLGVVGAVFTNKSRRPCKTPSRSPSSSRSPRRSSSEGLAVPDARPARRAWKADPGKVPVGGASNAGGPDHLTPMLLAKAVGVEPKNVNYVAVRRWRRAADRRPRQEGRLRRHRRRRGGGAGQDRRREDPRGHQRPAGRGDRRTDPEEPGVDLVFTNWRGIVGPPGLSDAKKQQYIDLLTKMHDSRSGRDAGRPGLDRRVPGRRRVEGLPDLGERPGRRRSQNWAC